MNTSIIENILGLGQKKEREFHSRAKTVLEFLGLLHIKDEMAGSQPYGTQKLIELGRTLISKPRLIILDEPAAGMNHTETEQLSALILKIRDELGVSVLLVEHDMSLVMKLCEQICVINFGKKIAEGTPEEVMSNEAVQEAYLGGEETLEAC